MPRVIWHGCGGLALHLISEFEVCLLASPDVFALLGFWGEGVHGIITNMPTRGPTTKANNTTKPNGIVTDVSPTIPIKASCSGTNFGVIGYLRLRLPLTIWSDLSLSRRISSSLYLPGCTSAQRFDLISVTVAVSVMGPSPQICTEDNVQFQ